jgi:hypothetical protein
MFGPGAQHEGHRRGGPGEHEDAVAEDPEFDVAGHLAELRTAGTDELERAFVQLDVAKAMAEAQQLLILSVLDERDVAKSAGMPGLPAWVAATSRVRTATAQRMVGAARRLARRAALAATAARGRLSFEQLEPALRAAVDDERDAFWAREAVCYSPHCLDEAARLAKGVDAASVESRRARTYFRTRHDAAAGMVRGSFALPDTDGETLLRAVEREVQAEAGDEAAREDFDRYEARAADAIVRLAAQRVVDDLDADRATIVVHTPIATLFGESDEPAEIDVTGIHLAPETLRYLACDCRLELVGELRNGLPVTFAQTRRTAPPKLSRALRRRDRHCRFPGCGRTKRLHAHHMVFWADGGLTVSTNLVMLCPFHHRLIHARHWTITGNPDDPAGLTFAAPDGRPPPGPPPPAHPRVQDLFALAT